MLRDQIGVFVVLLLIFLVPDRPSPKGPPEPDPPIPNLAGICNWGQIDQTGRKVVVFGHSYWHAEGDISRAGTGLKLTWIETQTGRPASGEYVIEANGRVAGKWNWLEFVAKDGLWMDDVLKPPFHER